MKTIQRSALLAVTAAMLLGLGACAGMSQGDNTAIGAGAGAGFGAVVGGVVGHEVSK